MRKHIFNRVHHCLSKCMKNDATLPPPYSQGNYVPSDGKKIHVSSTSPDASDLKSHRKTTEDRAYSIDRKDIEHSVVSREPVSSNPLVFMQRYTYAQKLCKLILSVDSIFTINIAKCIQTGFNVFY